MGKDYEGYRPREIAKRVSDIDFQYLHFRLGINKLLIDLDGTLAPACSMDINEPSIAHIKRAKNQGWISDVCLMSNAVLARNSPRVEEIASRFGFACHIGLAHKPETMKPRPEAWIAALQTINASKEETVMVGDQLRNDIFGANREGIYTVLVKTIPPILWWKIPTHWKDSRILKELGLSFPP